MELVKQSASWFTTEAACKAYAGLNTLEDRSVFLYSALRAVASESMDQQKIVFKVAFFLADAVANSSLPYAAYPDLVNPDKNPFVALLKYLRKPHGDDEMYCVLMAILYGVVDAFNPNEWIYKEAECKGRAFLEKLEEAGHGFMHSTGAMLPDPDAFKIDENLALARTELIWLFQKAG